MQKLNLRLAATGQGNAYAEALRLQASTRLNSCPILLQSYSGSLQLLKSLFLTLLRAPPLHLHIELNH